MSQLFLDRASKIYGKHSPSGEAMLTLTVHAALISAGLPSSVVKHLDMGTLNAQKSIHYIYNLPE